MKRIFRFILLMLATGNIAYCQLNNPLSQYNQVPYLQNPSLSGVERYTDIKAGFKKQWSTFKGAPQSYLLGVSHAFDKSAASADSGARFKKSIKVGLSGYIIENKYNAIKDTQLGLSYAVHVPISSEYYLSLGLSTNYNRVKANTNELFVRDTQDPFYQNLIADNGVLNYFNVDGGMVLYSDQLYVGYSIQRLSRTRFKSSVPQDENSNMRHTVLAGYNFKINEKWEVQPALLFRYESTLKDIYNLAMKFRYNAVLLSGLSYSPGESISLLTGYRLSNHVAIHYSYDLSIGKTSSVSQGSHEIILGITPFSKGGRKSIFW